MLLAEVALNLPLENNFYYIIAEDNVPKLFSRVFVNFSSRKEVGFVINIIDSESIKDKIQGLNLKPILSIIDETPIINKTIIEIASWMSRYYISSFGETLFAITPSAVKPKNYKHHYSYKGNLAFLNPEQKKALEEIEKFSNKYKTFLFHGVTGSGKTEIYKHLVKKYLKMGKSSIILIPEISLTPQTLERFYESFGDEVSIYHSRMTQSEKLGEWLRTLRGESHIVIGPRSAIFVPLQNLGLIIIDEEHETSYKSGNTPRYHARQIASYRAKKENAILVLGSATPQIETYYYAKKGNIHLIELKNRYGGQQLPMVEIVDLKKEENKNLITGTLLKKMLTTISQKKQILLFLNRRGFSPALICKACGYTFLCPNCNISLTFHKAKHNLICHHCGYAIKVPNKCPSCQNVALKEVGSGTEKLEEILLQQFPEYNIARMDLDTTRKRNSYFEILQKVKKGNIDILIGTQMVAKGHDIAGIQLVGVILPDIILNIPDFRSVERTFVLLTQVIGRAGRREQCGEAIIQTYLPEHYSIVNAKNQDYVSFYETEIEKRRTFNYPPFTRLGRIVFRSENLQKLQNFCVELKEVIKNMEKNYKNLQCIGPVSCPLEKLKKYFRYHIIIKCSDINEINRFINEIREYFKKNASQRFLYMEIDIDPLSLI